METFSRNGIAGREGDAAVAVDLAQAVHDVIVDVLRRLAADHVRVDAAEIADLIAVPFDPHGEMADGVLVGVLCVDVGDADDVVEHGKEVSAGVQQERPAGGVHQICDGAILGQNELADVVVGQKRGGVEAQIVAEAQHAVGPGVFVQKPLPDLPLHLPHLLEQVGVELGIVLLHEAQIHIAHQILHTFEYAVAHAADGLHALGAGALQRTEQLAEAVEVQLGKLLPGVALKVLAALDAALNMAAERAAAGQNLRDAALEGGGVIAHALPEGPEIGKGMIAEGKIRVVHVLVGIDADDILHHAAADHVLVQRHPRRLPVLRGQHDVAIIRDEMIVLHSLHILQSSWETKRSRCHRV